MILSDGRVRRVPFVLTAIAVASTLALAQQPAASRGAPLGTVDGLVADTSLVPLGDATVSIMGSRMRVVTGENGRFRMSDVAPGQYLLVVQRIGFEAATVRMQVINGDTLRLSIALERVGTVLDTVRVKGAKPGLARHADFDMRRVSHDATASFSEEDIAKRNPTQTWQMLTAVSSINVTDRQEDGNSMVVAASRRGMVTNIYGGNVKGNQPCFLKVMVDGVAVAADDAIGRTNLSNLPAPSSVYGIEVFAGPRTIPPQYSGAGDMKYCGLIAIWTK
jgi:hypothetical protein